MSERQLLERVCDTCTKSIILDGQNLTQAVVDEVEKWFIVGKIKHDGNGGFVPVASHHCSEKCATTYLLQQAVAPQNQPKNMEDLKKMVSN